MATNDIEPIVVTTGVRENVYKFVWKIQNWVTVQESKHLLEDQKFEICTDKASDIRSKWIVGLRLKPNAPTSVTRLYFKLLDVPNEIEKVSTKIRVTLEKSDGSSHWSDLVHKTLSLNEEFEVERNLGFSRPASDWSTVVDGNGTLTFSIQMDILQVTGLEFRTASVNPAVDNFRKITAKKIKTNFASILEDTATADLEIICSDGKKLAAHRAILKARCSVFESMIRSDLCEAKTGIVNVEDISSKTMKVLLHYLYTGELLESWSSPETVVEFAYAAGKYQLTEVLQMLDDMLGSDYDNNDGTCNLILLNLANKLCLKKAESRLMERIVRLTNRAKNSIEFLTAFKTLSS